MIVNSVNFQNNNVKNKKRTAAQSVRTLINKNNADSVSFSGGKTNFLSPIINIFKPKSTPVDAQTVCEKKLAEFTEKGRNGFIIFNTNGKLIHEQPENNYNIKTQTMNKLKDNILVTKQDELSLINILDYFIHGTKKVYSSFEHSESGKKQQIQKIITFPDLTPEKTNRAKKMGNNIIDTTNIIMDNVVETHVLTTGKTLIINDTTPLFEKIKSDVETEVFEKFTDELGIKIEKKPLPTK